MENHAFGNSNRRTCLVSADMFLQLNGLRLNTGLYSSQDVEEKRLERVLISMVRDKMTSDELVEEYDSIARACASVLEQQRNIVS